MNKYSVISCLFAFLWAFTGCATYTDLPAGTVQDITTSAILEQETVSVAAVQVSATPSLDYIVGRGDVLFVNVNGRTELSSPETSGSGKVSGSRVDGSGSIRLPLVGSIHVAGMTLAQIQTRLEEVFSQYLKESWVVVEISEYRSHPLYLIGKFQSPGTYYMDRPLTMINGLTMGGGMLDTANLRSARLIRDGETLPVDIYQLLRQGSMEHNIWLQSGDTIYVPDDKNQNVFIFGAVSSPGAVPIPSGRFSLSQALASAGFSGIKGNTEHVRIIRSLSATRGQLIVIDQSQVLQGKALPFSLMEGDIIYVPHSGMSSWNLALREMLPSLQAVGAILSPFVQIQYLTD
ncbi:MAG: polysaccharide biosynthesis/export family protein [Desulfobulbaceae bacterium]|jgi:polysaccharide export outer membrane protein|nr:polysaccharide biosynthesis/export family protein [Desulfobulbaceae bacterium]